MKPSSATTAARGVAMPSASITAAPSVMLARSLTVAAESAVKYQLHCHG